MPNLTRTWTREKYVPNIGDNRDFEKPFFFWVKSGLTKVELEELGLQLNVALGPPRPVDAKKEDPDPPSDWKAWAEAISTAVEMGTEPLSLNGKTIGSVGEYVEAVLLLGIGGAELAAMQDAVFHYNSVVGARMLFFERRSGGTGFTPALSAAKALH